MRLTIERMTYGPDAIAHTEEGKTVLVLAIGCTGGHHRSVAVAHALAEYIQNAGYPVTETHRDITR